MNSNQTAPVSPSPSTGYYKDGECTACGWSKEDCTCGVVDDDDDWKREMAMQAGMGGGVRRLQRGNGMGLTVPSPSRGAGAAGCPPLFCLASLGRPAL